MFKGSPAIAFGAYNFGLKKNLTNYNIIYGVIAKTIPVIGRLSVGYYTGNDKILVDENLKKANNGVLLSWDRTMTEISDKLWLAVDYQGGKNYLGALNLGVSWAFSKNVSVILVMIFIIIKMHIIIPITRMPTLLLHRLILISKRFIS